MKTTQPHTPGNDSPDGLLTAFSVPAKKKKGSLPKNNPRNFTLVGGDEENQRIVSGTLEELGQQPSKNFGEPLYCLVIVGKTAFGGQVCRGCILCDV